MLSAGDTPSTFELVHVGRSDSNPSTVCKLTPIQKVSADEIAIALADEVEAESEDHTQGYPGRQQYVLRGCTSEGRQVGEFPFWTSASNVMTHSHAATSLVDLTPEQAALSVGTMPEQLGHPTAMVATQLMRHTEGLVRNLVEMSSVNRERDAQIIRQLQAANDKHEGRHIQTLELMESMHSRQQERQLATKTYEHDEQRKDRLLDKLTTMVLPAVAQHLSLPGVGSSDNGDVSVADIKGIFMRLPDEMQNSFLEALNEEDKAKLMSAFEGGGGTKH